MLQQEVEALLHRQLEAWPLARRNFDDLSAVESAELRFPQTTMRATFNPGRIRSTAAKVDPHTIAERRCFLCAANRPAEQEGIDTGRYTVLLNPYPIFRRHLTIPDRSHTDQRMDRQRMLDLLAFARELPDWTLFYNGPRCGASAPDHFHFQAGERGYMPAEAEATAGARTLVQREGVRIAADEAVRAMLLFEGADAEPVADAALAAMEALGRTTPREPEPMVNLLAFHEAGLYRLLLYPRREHRPRQFFAEGEEQIVFSPGAVDFGGVLVLPRREDFERLRGDRSLVADLFAQLTLEPAAFESLCRAIQTSER